MRILASAFAGAALAALSALPALAASVAGEGTAQWRPFAAPLAETPGEIRFEGGSTEIVGFTAVETPLDIIVSGIVRGDGEVLGPVLLTITDENGPDTPQQALTATSSGGFAWQGDSFVASFLVDGGYAQMGFGAVVTVSIFAADDPAWDDVTEPLALLDGRSAAISVVGEEMSEIPVPAAAPLLLGALGGFALLRRRRG